jgi:hypothetical protein
MGKGCQRARRYFSVSVSVLAKPHISGRAPRLPIVRNPCLAMP